MDNSRNMLTKIPINKFQVQRYRELYKIFFWMDCLSEAAWGVTVNQVRPYNFEIAILELIVWVLAITVAVIARIFYYKLSAAVRKKHVVVYLLLSLIPFLPWILFFDILSASKKSLISGYSIASKRLIVNYKKFFAIFFFVGYIVSLLATSVFFVPKNITFHETSGIVESGYYPIWAQHSSGWPGIDLVVDNVHYTYPPTASTSLDLHMDYLQWMMLTFVESMALLFPSVVFFKMNSLHALEKEEGSSQNDA